MATKYECDRCGESVISENLIKTILFVEHNTSVKCWDFGITEKDICEHCARDLGDFLKPLAKPIPAPTK